MTETADIVAVLEPIMGMALTAREPEPTNGDRPYDVDPAADERARIVALLSPAPVQVDDLVRLAKSSPRVVRLVLLELELGLVSLV